MPSYEVDYFTKTGERRRALLSIGLVSETKDEVVTFVDITAETQLRRQLVQSEKIAALGQLVAGVAHELNNPLSAILGSAELALSAASDPVVIHNLHRIIEQTDRCCRIVNNLLSFAREHRYELMPVDVNMLIRQVAEMEAYEMAVDNIDLHLHLQEDLPPVSADPSYLQQVLLNLIVNAHQAMRATGGGHLTIRTERRRRRVLITVHDTGPGIPPEHMDKIFDPFFTTKPPGEGTGLGLSVSLAIVRELGGRMWAESRPGAGATFYVELPLATIPPQSQTTRKSAAASEPPVPDHPARVLVVDDEPAVRDVVESALETAGYLVQSACDGNDALTMLRTGDFHAVVCDLRIPGIDGPRLYRTIIAEKPQLARRFIFITGDTLSEHARQFLQSTKCPALHKPFRLTELRQVVTEVATRQQRSSGR
ncbi:MAG: response regulator [Armatimonadetes bacterium]|nr:response regulator [Armatimonadota bacterium]